ncbi:MAG TPA: hypothetical protein VIA62_11370 [Thermoanaerobaculia bacterium]|jgi:hypothetical protein|nr:hypothetical protein [Thermoanaerobaculia bacterium]
MNRKSLLKLGFAALIATATMLGATTSHAAGRLCVFSYTQGDRTCTYTGNVNGCCQYVDQNGRSCHPICGV